MTWFFAVLVVLTMGAVVVVAAGYGEPLGTAYDDRPDVLLPADRPVTGADLRELRLNTAFRGYRADEVDALLDRLAAELDAAREQHPSDEEAGGHTGDGHTGDEHPTDEPPGPRP